LLFALTNHAANKATFFSLPKALRTPQLCRVHTLVLRPE